MHPMWWTFLLSLLALGGVGRGEVGPLPEYATRAWQTDEGLPNNLVRAIAQTPDGYLWVGTRWGLARFDGLRFTTFNPKNTPALQNPNISALCVAADGSLWIGTFGGGLHHATPAGLIHFGPADGLAGDELSALCAAKDDSLWIGTTTGLSHYQQGRFRNFTRAQGLASDIVRGLCDAGDGSIWVATGEGLHRIHADALETFTPTNGLPDKSVRGLWRDHTGRLWIGSDHGAICYQDGKFTTLATENGLTDPFVNNFCEDRNGNFWVGTYSGLNRLDHGRFFSQRNVDAVSYDLINALFEDREGSIWVGSREGLARLTPKRVLTVTRQTGLSHNNVMSVLEDRAGRLWAGTWGGGLNCLNADQFSVFSTRNGWPHDLILSLCEARDGSLWAGADFDGGLIRLKEGRLTHYTWHDGLPNAALRVLHEDRAGNLWVGTSRGLACFHDGQFTNYTVHDGLAGDAVRAICEDHRGDLWFGTESGLSCWRDHRFTNFSQKEGLSADVILALYEDPQQDLWIGTEGGGLLRRRDGRFSCFTTKSGLFSDDVFEIVEDDYGYLWMSCLKGISRVSKAELDQCASGRIQSAHAAAYGRADGLLSAQCNGVSKPAGFKSHDGRIWFPTTKGLVAIDATIKLNSIPPPIAIEAVLADQKPVTRGPWRTLEDPTPLRIPPGCREFEIHYTALSLQQPEKNRFRYRLEGLDAEWIAADTRRIAYYTHVPPGHYRFHVSACNNDGLWNEHEALLELVLQPVFWQTGWFLSLAGLGLLGTLAGSVRYVSNKRLARRVAQLEQQHALEKERARIAKDIHDDLGANLTKITLLSDRAQNEEMAELRANTRKISATAREMAQSLDEIVWAVNPLHDTLEGLIEYLSQSADDFLEDTTIRSRVIMPSTLPPCRIAAEARHQLFLAFKEALNNAVKHAHASEIAITLATDPGQFSITIADNGTGFEPGSVAHGRNGLLNMRKRLESIGGRFELNSRRGQGTEIRMGIPLEPE